mmetsp:Transcript_98831/g.279955  ORF Transcript_98831/g.279955 Transcript_98831/m.279955 type:complete len:216 (+) Transcript_98831:289-936(+)
MGRLHEAVRLHEAPVGQRRPCGGCLRCTSLRHRVLARADFRRRLRLQLVDFCPRSHGVLWLDLVHLRRVRVPEAGRGPLGVVALRAGGRLPEREADEVRLDCARVPGSYADGGVFQRRLEDIRVRARANKVIRRLWVFNLGERRPLRRRTEAPLGRVHLPFGRVAETRPVFAQEVLRMPARDEHLLLAIARCPRHGKPGQGLLCRVGLRSARRDD